MRNEVSAAFLEESSTCAESSKHWL